MKKQLFFNYYVTYENFNGIINNIHYTCLDYYKHVFDEVFINISVDNTEDNHLILMAQNKFLNIFNGIQQKITFKVVKNDPLMRECVFFYEEIIDKLSERDIVFFAHNKGLTNLDREDVDTESLFHWIVAMYYSSLDFHEDAMHSLIAAENLMYGSCPTYINNSYMYYSGAFFWMNCKRIHNYLQLYNVPKLIKSDRCGAEKFCNYLKINMEKVAAPECIYPCIYNRYILHINTEEESDSWYLNGKDFCETLGYLNEDFYKLYNKAIKEEYFK
jgi:hypothetical protein